MYTACRGFQVIGDNVGFGQPGFVHGVLMLCCLRSGCGWGPNPPKRCSLVLKISGHAGQGNAMTLFCGGVLYIIEKLADMHCVAETSCHRAVFLSGSVPWMRTSEPDGYACQNHGAHVAFAHHQRVTTLRKHHSRTWPTYIYNAHVHNKLSHSIHVHTRSHAGSLRHLKQNQEDHEY